MDQTGNPLRIGLISYRSNPHCGGQGVYIRNLSKALTDLGHHVEVIAGPPDPLLEQGPKLSCLNTLDLYNPEDLFRTPKVSELTDPISLLEWLGVSTMGYPEPATFSLRAFRFLKDRFSDFDVIHDNQCLGYGIWAISRYVPTVATIHHPMTVDRRLAVQSTRSYLKKLKYLRWYSFIGMQKRVARKLPRIITVSAFSRDDIVRAFGIPADRFSIVPNGINMDRFHPLPGIEREPDRLIVTNSADMALKGLYYLLVAVHQVAQVRPVKLTVIGQPKENGGVEKLVKKLGIGHLITFTGRVSDEKFLEHYAQASVAVVPSLYEGFGLPVGEAMACGLPVITTTGGALPEVAGHAAKLVPPADADALSHAIIELLDNPDLRDTLGAAGYKRIQEMFTWKQAAIRTVAAYREVIRAYR